MNRKKPLTTGRRVKISTRKASVPDRVQCRRWVKLGSGSASTLLLLCPNERTSRDAVTESFGAKVGSRAYWQIDSAGRWSHSSLRCEPGQQHDLAAEPASVDARVNIFRGC